MTEYEHLRSIAVPVETCNSRAAWALEKLAAAVAALPKVAPTVRDMTDDDVPSLLEIENSSFPEGPYPERIFRSWQAAGGGVKVADVGGKPVGYIMHRDDPDQKGFRYGTSLAVHPDHRRGGIGEALMTDLVSSYPQISADVDATNGASKNLLKKLGFKSVRAVRERGRLRHRMHLDKPYRDRAELYAMKDGKLYGSLFPHGGFGVYGGGIDEGEDPHEAAAREFAEEAGWNVGNVKELPFTPHTLDWKPPYTSQKTAERAKQFRGSRTRYFIGDLGDQIPNAKLDELGRKDARLYDLEEAIRLADQKGLDPDIEKANKKRVEVLQHLKASLVKKADDDEPDPEVEEEIKKIRSEKRYLGRYKCPHCGGKNLFNGIPGTGTTFRGSGHCQDCQKGCSIVGSKLKRLGDGPEIVFSDEQADEYRKSQKMWKRFKAKSAFDNCAYEPKLYLVKRAKDEEEDRPFTICVDLDGTLAEQEKPFKRDSIGAPIDRAIEWVRLFHENGARIIIFTVRGDVELVEEWLKEHEVPYDYVNENPDQPPDSSGKVFADVYWDDRGYNAIDPDENGPTILRKVLAHNGEDEEPEDEHGPSPVMRIDRTVITISGPMLLECMEDDDGDSGPGDD